MECLKSVYANWSGVLWLHCGLSERRFVKVNITRFNMASNLFSEAHLIEFCKDIQKCAIDGFSPAINWGLQLIVLCVPQVQNQVAIWAPLFLKHIPLDHYSLLHLLDRRHSPEIINFAFRSASLELCTWITWTLLWNGIQMNWMKWLPLPFTSNAVLLFILSPGT